MRYSFFWDISQLDCEFVINVAGKTIGPIFKGQTVQENGTKRLSLNVGNKLPVSEERIFNLPSKEAESTNHLMLATLPVVGR